MEVASTSPDTGQRGGCTPACSLNAQALSGKTVRVTLLIVIFMQIIILNARLAVLPLALVAAFPVFAQNQTEGVFKEVVVTASRFPESADALPYGVSVITAQEIASSGASSVSEAIVRVLGVPGHLDTSGGNNYSLDIRGFGAASLSNQVVMVDGRRLNEQDLSGADLGAVPIASVQRIEVIRGSAGVVYGEGATGGVILVTTKAGKGVERSNSAVLSAATGSFGLSQFQANATLASGGFSVDVNASDRKSNGHRENFASQSNTLGATAQWSNDWLRLGAQSASSQLHSGFPGALTAAKYEANPQQANSLVDYGDSKNEKMGVFAEVLVGDWQLGLDVGTRSKKSDAYYGPSYSSSLSVDASSTNLRARHDYKNETLANTLTLGVDRGAWKSVDAYLAKAQSDSNAVYVTDELGYLATGTRLSVGLRDEKLKKSKDSATMSLDESQTAWHLGVTQDVLKGVQAYGRAGQSFRLANVDEINFIAPGAALKAQTSKDFELGTRWQHDAGRVELRWYRSDVNNEIGYDSTAPNAGSWNGMGANVNFDPTRRQGLELEARQTLNPQTTMRLNAASRKASFVAGQYAGKTVALVPSNTLALGLDWVPAAQHLLNMGVTWVSAQYPDFANKCSMPAYSILDARYAYSTKAAELSLGVSNLADAKHFTLAYGCTAGGQATSIYPEAGRAVVATMKLKF
jgi:iron complex outermembrane receptor protein